MFFLAPLPLAIMALGGTAYYVKTKRDKAGANSGVMTADRQAVFETAMNQVAEPEKLTALANTFHGEGLHEQARALRSRAVLRGLPEDVKKARKEVYKKAMNSTNKQAVRSVAVAFHGEGATGAAQALMDYANGLP